MMLGRDGKATFWRRMRSKDVSGSSGEECVFRYGAMEGPRTVTMRRGNSVMMKAMGGKRKNSRQSQRRAVADVKAENSGLRGGGGGGGGSLWEGEGEGMG